MTLNGGMVGIYLKSYLLDVVDLMSKARINPDPKRCTKYCEHCGKWHIAGASYGCGQDDVREIEPLDQQETTVKIVSSSWELMAKDALRQGIQQLYLLGWSSEQVVDLVKSLVRNESLQ